MDQIYRPEGLGETKSTATPQPDKYMPGLDVLRGAAIISVLFYHGIYWQGLLHQELQSVPYYHRMAAASRYGYLGVNLFFVLSGFLITGILLDTKTDKDYFKTFYLRRIVRIVPAYILMIIVLKLMREISWSFVLVSLLYLCNMGHGFQRHGYSPFWSLSVEEQFYLVWPFIILKLKPRFALIASVAIVLLTPLLRFALLHLSHQFSDIDYKTWSIADFFAGGSTVAICVRSRRLRPHLWKVCLFLVGAGLIGFQFVWAPSTSAAATPALRALYYSPWVSVFSGLVLFAFLCPALSRLWFSRFLSFAGYISYGLYLCHSLIMRLFERHWTLASLTGERLARYVVLRFFVECVSAMAIAWLSRTTFEAFFLRMKPRQPKRSTDLVGV